MDAPLVSVVIPYYNGAGFITRALDSVVGQSYGTPEIVVVDDGSAEDPSRLLEPFLDSGRVRLLRHTSNKGIAAARNTGIRASRSEFVAFLDQDDTWLPRKLELQLADLGDAPDRDVGLFFADVGEGTPGGRVRKLATRGRIPSDLNSLPREAQLRALFGGNLIPLISAIVRRECFATVGLFDESIKGGADDYEFCLRLVEHSRIHYLPEIVAVHWTHGENYSADIERLISDAFRFLTELAHRHSSLRRLLRPRLAQLHLDLAKYYLHEGNAREARASFEKSLLCGGRSASLFPALLLSCCGTVGSRLYRARRSLMRRLNRCSPDTVRVPRSGAATRREGDGERVQKRRCLERGR